MGEASGSSTRCRFCPLRTWKSQSTLPLRICRSTFTTLPGVKVSSKIMVLNLDTRCRSRYRFKGRAPSSGSCASFKTKSTAASVTCIVTSSSSKRFRTSASCSRTTCRRRGPVNGWKTTMSSRRFNSSGRKVLRMLCSTNPLALSSSSALPLLRARIKCSEPRLEVKITTQLLQSTVRPCESVMRPSSNSWSSTLSTCGCAFSISSKSTTL
mmetsp:Transcript_72462/g.114921  ORF Transcript_72462/g.114921 Transcript_72462/m.114921 type:complete len:211 (-) Transcript_72462:2068-2700(-)